MRLEDRRKPPPPPPPPPAYQVSGVPPILGPNNPPPEFLPIGVMTESEKEGLREFGLDDIASVPADMADRIEAARRKVNAAPQNPGAAVPTPVPFDQLDPAVQQSLRQSILDGIEVSKRQAAAASGGPPPEPPPRASSSSTVAAAAEALRTAQTPVEEPPSYAQPSAMTAKYPEPPTAEPPPAVQLCPQCRWNMSTPLEEEWTDEEKERFVVYIMGGPRFEKTYRLYGGKVEVTFREMATRERELIDQQILSETYVDVEKNRLRPGVAYASSIMQYETIVCLAQIRTQNDSTEFPVLADFQADAADPRTPLRQMYELATEDCGPLGALPLFKSVGTAYVRFRTLCDTLMHRARDENF